MVALVSGIAGRPSGIFTSGIERPLTSGMERPLTSGRDRPLTSGSERPLTSGSERPSMLGRPREETSGSLMLDRSNDGDLAPNTMTLMSVDFKTC